MRPRGNADEKSPIRSSIPSIISEEKAPGAMAFTFILNLAHSTARHSVVELKRIWLLSECKHRFVVPERAH